MNKEICIHGKPDCFAWGTYGICTALRDTDFGDRMCPFYKPREQFEEEQEAAKQRINMLKRPDLADDLRKFRKVSRKNSGVDMND